MPRKHRRKPATRLLGQAKQNQRQILLALVKRLRSNCAVVTQLDLQKFREHIEGQQFLPTSSCLYLARLGELLSADVLLVDSAGRPVLVHDQRQHEEIEASMRRFEKKLARRAKPAWVRRWEAAATRVAFRDTSAIARRGHHAQ